MADVLDAKQAAREADAAQNQIYNAIYSGALRFERKKGRVLIFRSSFEQWRRRLEMRRALRAETEQEEVGA